MKKQRLRFLILFILLSAALAVAGFQIVSELNSQQKEKDDFNTLAELVKPAPDESFPPAPGSNEPEPEETAALVEPAVRDLTALFEQNSECIGWLCIADTQINYPVMHTPRQPQKYLRLNFHGESSQSGVPFLDYRCSLDGTNLILYGHNMKNGTMFSNLRYYTDADFCAEHAEIEFQTADSTKVYEIFAVLITSNTDAWYTFIAAESEEDYAEHISDAITRASCKSGTAPEYGSQLLTLSTCYGGSKSGRLLVLAAEKSSEE